VIEALLVKKEEDVDEIEDEKHDENVIKI